MNEELLHYIWQHKLYNPDKLITLDGQSIEVLHPGHPNTNAGPDFFNAKIKLNGILWAGNVEVHVNAGDWAEHGHHKDAAYDNVILHVVHSNKGEALTTDGRKVPVFELPVPTRIANKYMSIQSKSSGIACAAELDGIDPFVWQQWLDRLLLERLEEKHALIKQQLDATNGDWDQAFFVLMARSFGFGLNGLPFEMMARQTPLVVLLKHADNLFQMESLLLGQAGFLTDVSNENRDDYTQKLMDEYAFLRHKYDLKPIERHVWKFLRLRPPNFPTIRLVQLAKLMVQIKGCFSKLQELSSPQNIVSQLCVVATDYWDTHYQPGDAPSMSMPKRLGKHSAQRIVNNTIVPYLFFQMGQQGDWTKQEQLMEVLYGQVPEKNSILDEWTGLGLQISNEGQAQALIFLKTHYCNHKKCLNCHIGHKVLINA